MTDRERYQNMEDEIHVPSEMLGKVMNMKNENLKMKSVVRNAVSVAASLAAVFVVTNGICYAATGDTWVEKAAGNAQAEKKTVPETEESKKSDIIHYTETEDGTSGKLTWSDGEISFQGNSEEIEKLDGSICISDYAVINQEEVVFHTAIGGGNGKGCLLEKDGKIYLLVPPGDSIDITDDFADGTAEGEAEIDGQKYRYKVSGTIEEFQIELEKR